jgi:nucleotide-binding universal stress UspA family protein
MRILVAVDGSESSLEAVRFLKRLPHRESLSISILTVISLPDVPRTATTDLWFSKYVAGQKAINDEIYTNAAAIFTGESVNLTHLSKQGHVGHAIVTAADETQCDLIVIGSKGHSPLDRVVLGSTSDFVATHSSRSVLVVRAPTRALDADEKLKITIAYDESKYSEFAIQQFSEFQWAKNSEVEVLTIVPRHRLIDPGFFEAPFDRREEIIQKALLAAEAASRNLRKQLIQTTTNAIEADHVADKIVELTNRSKPDLIVVGDRGRSSIAKMLLGSVSQHVLRQSTQSVWIVRHDGAITRQ